MKLAKIGSLQILSCMLAVMLAGPAGAEVDKVRVGVQPGLTHLPWAVIEHERLIAALQAGRIAGAGLDAFTQEPPDPGSPLWHLPNVVVTPHVGGSTREAMTRVAVQAVKNIFTVLEGETPDPRFVVTEWTF